MNTTDPVADMLTRYRNAFKSHHSKVEMPSSRLKTDIAKILKEEGFISSYKVSEEDRKRTLRVTLRYGGDGQPAVSKMQRVSRPGRRVYASHRKIPSILGGMGTCILTTPQGVMTGKKAREAGLGGEVLLEIW